MMAGPEVPAKSAIHGRDCPLPEHPESVPSRHNWGIRVPTSHSHPPKPSSEMKEWPTGRTTSTKKTEWKSPGEQTRIVGTDLGVKRSTMAGTLSPTEIDARPRKRLNPRWSRTNIDFSSGNSGRTHGRNSSNRRRLCGHRHNPGGTRNSHIQRGRNRGDCDGNFPRHIYAYQGNPCNRPSSSPWPTYRRGIHQQNVRRGITSTDNLSPIMRHWLRGKIHVREGLIGINRGKNFIGTTQQGYQEIIEANQCAYIIVGRGQPIQVQTRRR